MLKGQKWCCPVPTGRNTGNVCIVVSGEDIYKCEQVKGVGEEVTGWQAIVMLGSCQLSLGAAQVRG